MNRALIAVVAAGSAAVLLGSQSGSAASVTVSTTGGDRYSYDFNPLAGKGLIPVASEESSGTGLYVGKCGSVVEPLYDYRVDSESSMAAAAYGSDSSIDGRYSPGLIGKAVEPMVEATAFASVSRYAFGGGNMCGPTSLGSQIGYGSATASGDVNHRIVALPALPQTPKPLTEIPVLLDWYLFASASGNADYMGGTSSGNAAAWARFRVSLEGIPFIEKVAECRTPNRSPHYCETEDKGTESITLYRTTTTTEYLYNIRVFAEAEAAPSVDLIFGSAEAEAFAVVDPFLYIDPTWEYAQYFVVQQESTLNPGEWADVTREWQATTVPAPPGLGLLATGIVGLGGRRLMRRKLTA